MSKTVELFNEAINPLTKIANGIAKKLNYIESSLILKANSLEDAKDFLSKTAAYHSNAYADLSDEQKENVLEKVWNIIHNSVSKPTDVTENQDNTSLEQKIYEFLKTEGGIIYPSQTYAKKLANYIKNN